MNTTANAEDRNARLATVPFRGQNLSVVTTDTNDRLVALRPICEAIGLAWSGQYERVMRHEVLGATVRVVRTVADDGKSREVVCLPVAMLNGWLFGVDSKRVKPGIKDALLQYQRECYTALSAYWNDGVAVRPESKTPGSLLGTTIGTDGFHCLAAVLDGKVRHLPAPIRKRAKMHVWSQVHKAFSVVSAEDIPADQIDSVRNFIAAYSALEGEWIAKEEEQQLDICAWSSINVLLSVVEESWRVFEHYRLYTHLSGLGCPAGAELLGLLWDGMGSARHIKKRCAEQLDAVRLNGRAAA